MAKRKSKSVTIPTGRITKKWTTRQLKAYIRVQTALAEERIKNLTVEDTKVAGIDKEISKLQRVSGVKPRKGHTLGLGLSYKKKEALLKQARALQSFGNKAISKLENLDRVQKAYNTYKQSHPDITFEEWQKQVEAVNTYGNELFDHPFKDGERVDTNLMKIIEQERALYAENSDIVTKELNIEDILHKAYVRFKNSDRSEFDTSYIGDRYLERQAYIDVVYDELEKAFREALGLPPIE